MSSGALCTEITTCVDRVLIDGGKVLSTMGRFWNPEQFQERLETVCTGLTHRAKNIQEHFKEHGSLPDDEMRDMAKAVLGLLGMLYEQIDFPDIPKQTSA